MYYCNNYALAVVFCVVTMFCWGSWGNTQKLAGKTWRYELFYWDYVLGVVPERMDRVSLHPGF